MNGRHQAQGTARQTSWSVSCLRPTNSSYVLFPLRSHICSSSVNPDGSLSLPSVSAWTYHKFCAIPKCSFSLNEPLPPQSGGDLRAVSPQDSQWWVSLQTHGVDVLLGCPGGPGQGLVSDEVTGVLLLDTLLLCFFVSGETGRGKCHSCLQEEQEEKSGRL